MTGGGSSGDDRDYGAMQAALSETERGRWFLAEHARRHRGGDTEILLDAIGRIEAAVTGRSAVAVSESQGEDLSDVALAVTRIRDALTGAAEDASPRESLARLSEAATSDVLDATERIQEAAWTLRERGADPAICDLLDQRASDIYAACAVQDGLARRIAAAVGMVRSLEDRLVRARTGMTPAAPAAAEASNRLRPAKPIARRSAAPDQAASATVRPPTVAPHEGGSLQDAQGFGDADRRAGVPVAPSFARSSSEIGAHLRTLEDIDALGAVEKLRLFT